MEILGAPEIELELASDKPLAMIAVRLSDVAPDDKATRVTYGMLNLTHRHSREHPVRLEPGQRERVRVKLNDIAQRFPQGHRIRLSISTSYWPLAWPPPFPVRLTVYTRQSVLRLPVRPPRPDEAKLHVFPLPEGAKPAPRRQLAETHHNWLVHRDLAQDRSTLEVIDDNGIVLLEDIGLEVESRAFEWYSSQADDFLSVKGETRSVKGLRRGAWSVRSEMHTVLTCTESHFRITADIDAFENGVRVFCRSWDVSIPRDFV